MTTVGITNEEYDLAWKRYQELKEMPRQEKSILFRCIGADWVHASFIENMGSRHKWFVDPTSAKLIKILNSPYYKALVKAYLIKHNFEKL